MAKPKKSPLRRLLVGILGRLVITALLALGLIWVAGSSWHRKETGVPSELWDQEKLEWSSEADTVILGDSRAGSGLLPRVVDAAIPGRRTLSFTFSNNGYTPQYLAHAERVLVPPGKGRRSIVMSISPFALSEKQQKISYTEADHGKVYAFKWKHLTWLMSFTKPFGKWPVIDAIRGKGERGWYREHNKDGSWTGYRIPSSPEMGPARVRAEYAGAVADPTVIEGLLRAVRQMREHGITVYGYRPPTSPELYALEDEATHWNELRFPERFIEAGGVWIVIPEQPDGWNSYDGSHIPPDRSERLSNYVVQAMKAHEAGSPSPLLFQLRPAQTATSAVSTSTTP